MREDSGGIPHPEQPPVSTPKSAVGLHTKGPWERRGPTSVYGNCQRDQNGTADRVAVTDREEDAGLIAAALDLLEAVRDTTYALECEAEVIDVDLDQPCQAEELCGEPFCENSGCIVLRIRLARAAILKATGGEA